MKILAIDFETADYGADSACALGIALIENGAITLRTEHLIRPPRRRFVFTYIHGLTWQDVKGAQPFSALVPDLSRYIRECDFIAAHNAAFDRKVLLTCFAKAGVRPPDFKMICTVKLAKRELGFRAASLPVVCYRLGIGLNHHDAMSDANACGEILVRAISQGARLENAVLGRPTYHIEF